MTCPMNYKKRLRRLGYSYPFPITSTYHLMMAINGGNTEYCIDLGKGKKRPQTVRHTKGVKTFHVTDHFDGSELDLIEPQLFTHSSIGEAIEKRTFYRNGYTRDDFYWLNGLEFRNTFLDLIYPASAKAFVCDHEDCHEVENDEGSLLFFGADDRLFCARHLRSYTRRESPEN